MTSKDDLIRWSEALAGIARTGLGFTASAYEAERYEEVLAVAADIRAALEHPDDQHPDGAAIDLRAEWLRSVGSGVPGYVTPKVAVGAVVAMLDRSGPLSVSTRYGVMVMPSLAMVISLVYCSGVA